MGHYFKERIMTRNFWINILLFFFLELFFGIVIKVKGGNLNSYLGIIIPELIVITAAFAYTSLLETYNMFTVSCVLLLQIGITMQCIVQNEAANLTLKQSAILLVSLAAAVIMVVIHMKLLSRLETRTLLIVVTGLTLLAYLFLLVAGRTINGARAWFVAGPFSLQITEFIKILWVYFNANVFCSDRFSDFKKLVLAAGYFLLNALGSILIGEMGSLLIMLALTIMFCILFIDSRKVLLGVFGCGALLAACGVGGIAAMLKYGEGREDLGGFVLKIYNICSRLRTRLVVWINPESDPLNAGYQGIRAKQAISIGGLLGSNHRISLPVAESDFIFPTIIMNLGVIIALIVVVLFIVILVYGIKMYLDSWNDEEMGIIAGCVFYIFTQSMIMILGSTGYIIMTGVPIAFISDGGTAMMVSFIMTALIITLSSGSSFDDVFIAADPDRPLPARKEGTGKDDRRGRKGQAKKKEKDIYRQL